MLEFFMGLVEMFKTDPAAFFTTILSYAGLTGVSVGTLWGIVKGVTTLGKIIFGKDRKAREEQAKFVNMITTSFGGILDNLSNLKTEFVESIKQNSVEISAEMKKLVEQKLGLTVSKLTVLEAKINAFSQVVLDNEMLKLQFETLQNEFLATKNVIEEKVEEIKEVVLEPIIAPTLNETPIVDSLPAEQPTRKIRLKQRV